MGSSDDPSEHSESSRSSFDEVDNESTKTDDGYDFYFVEVSRPASPITPFLLHVGQLCALEDENVPIGKEDANAVVVAKEMQSLSVAEAQKEYSLATSAERKSSFVFSKSLVTSSQGARVDRKSKHQRLEGFSKPFTHPLRRNSAAVEIV